MKIRKATTKDLHKIYLMGFDAWSQGDSLEQYLLGCAISPNYKIGTWFVLEKGGDIVASLMVFQGVLKLPERSIGIGSVATANKYKRKGYASLLVDNICRLYKTQGVEFAYLFSEIGPSFYQRLGFVELRDTCMIKTLGAVKTFPAGIPDGF